MSNDATQDATLEPFLARNLRWGQLRPVKFALAQVLEVPRSALISVAQGRDLDAGLSEGVGEAAASGKKAETAGLTLLGDASWLVATAWGLAQVTGGELIWQQPWTDAVTAKSVPDHGVIEVLWGDGETSALRLDDPSRLRRRGLGLVIKEQIQGSIVLSEKIPLPANVAAGKQHVLIAIRKDEHGQLFSQVLGPAMLDLDDPRINTQIANTESRLRNMCGLSE